MITAGNPWQRLPDSPPYILAEDFDSVAVFNSTAQERYKIRLEIFPEPFLGRPEAGLVLLGLNPGFKDVNLVEHRVPRFAELSRANLLHESAKYPFYLLDPSIERTKYWERKLRHLIERFGITNVAQGVFCIEYFPYHSERFKHTKLSLPSQQYSFLLAREAIRRNAHILLLRGKKSWFSAVPELETYKRLYVPNSVQNPVVSPRNFPDGFPAALEALDRSNHFVEDFSEGGISFLSG